MTTREKIGDDLAFVRAALERQRQFVCDRISPALALGTGLFLVGLSMTKDLVQAGLITDKLADGAVLFLMISYIAALFLTRRSGKAGCATSMTVSEQISHGMPMLIWVGGLLLFVPLLEQLGVPAESRKVILIYFSGVALLIVGARGLLTARYMGIGLLLGGLAKLLPGLAFDDTLIGIGMGGGFILGAWLDRRAIGGVGRSADHVER
ncbi:MAG: hypothetical protein Tsb008_20740 [Rhodothalassiaceae bacterium]